MTTPASPKEEKPPKEAGLFFFLFFLSFFFLLFYFFIFFSALVPIEFYRGYALELPWVACILTCSYQSYHPSGAALLWQSYHTLPGQQAGRTHFSFLLLALLGFFFLYLARPRSFSCLPSSSPPPLLFFFFFLTRHPLFSPLRLPFFSLLSRPLLPFFLSAIPASHCDCDCVLFDEHVGSPTSSQLTTSYDHDLRPTTYNPKKRKKKN